LAIPDAAIKASQPKNLTIIRDFDFLFFPQIPPTLEERIHHAVTILSI
jgi:hypothetical protein